MREPEWSDRDWDRLVDQIKRGDCTPFLGAGACSPTLPVGADLGQQWADHYDYPFEDRSNLPGVMQYASVIERDPVTVKQLVARDLSERGEPDFSDPAEPHRLLAEHPINVYLTTNYDNFMTRALELAGKEPVTAVCPWYRGAETHPLAELPDGYRPHGHQPLVYHLHGRLEHEPSLVLAEQDYLEFLVTLAQDLGCDDRRVVPIQILPALTQHPLLFIGYSLRDWPFRMLFHGFVGNLADVMRRQHVSVQLSPKLDDDEAQGRAEEFLIRYFTKMKISVYWGEASEFCRELRHRLEGP